MNHFSIIIDYDEQIECLTIIDGYTDERKKFYNVKSISDVSEYVSDYLCVSNI